MNSIDPPLRTPPPSEREADRLVELFRSSSRDHSATLLDDAMCRALADNWPAIEQALMQIQRDMSRPVADAGANTNLNAIFTAFSQIHSRLLAFVDRGTELNRTKSP